MTQKELCKYIISMITYDTKNALINIKRLHGKKYHSKIAMFAYDRNIKEIIEYYINTDLIDGTQKHLCLAKSLFYVNDLPYIIKCYKNPTFDKYLFVLINKYFSFISINNMSLLNSFNLVKNRFHFYVDDKDFIEIKNIYDLYLRNIKLSKLLK